MMKPIIAVRASILFVACVAVGCHAPEQITRRPLPVLSMAEAIAIPDANTARIAGTVRASGSVNGHFMREGRRRSYDLDGVLFFLAPDYVRFDLKKFGDRQLLFGANEELFWIYSKQQDEFACWNRNDQERIPEEMPIRPDQIADALGLRLIGDIRAANDADIVQRVTEDAQQILVVVRDPAGRMILEKEYWLDRYHPRLVSKVIFRDAHGNIELTSQLSNYRAIDRSRPMLPYEMEATWPRTQAQMRFQVNKWTEETQVGPTGPQFATPRECPR